MTDTPVAWAMVDKETGSIVSLDTKPPFDPRFIPADWTREQRPLYFHPAPSPEALPTCEKCDEEITGTPVYVKGTEGVLHLNCSLRSE